MTIKTLNSLMESKFYQALITLERGDNTSEDTARVIELLKEAKTLCDQQKEVISEISKQAWNIANKL